MDIATLPRDAQWHLLMQEHPVDLYQVSSSVPSLKKISQEVSFQKAYLSVWLTRLETASRDSEVSVSTRADVAALRKPFLLQGKLSIVQLDELVLCVLDHRDFPTCQWILTRYHQVWTNKHENLTTACLHHPALTSEIRHLMFDLDLADPNEYLLEGTNYQQPALVTEYLYRHDVDYTIFFQTLVKREALTELELYLTEEVDFRVVDVLLQTVRSKNLAILKLCLSRIKYMEYEIKHACQITLNRTLRACLKNQAQLVVVDPAVAPLQTTPIPGTKMSKELTYGFIVIILPGYPRVWCQGILDEENAIVSVNASQRRLALRLGMIFFLQHDDEEDTYGPDSDEEDSDASDSDEDDSNASDSDEEDSDASDSDDDQ